MKRLLLAAVAALTLLSVEAGAADEYRPVRGHSFPFDATGRAVTDLAASGYKGGYNVSAGVGVLRLVCSTACFVAFSATDVTPSISATSTTAMFLPANVPEYVKTSPRSRIAVIRSASDGTLYIGEMSK